MNNTVEGQLLFLAFLIGAICGGVAVSALALALL